MAEETRGALPFRLRTILSHLQPSQDETSQDEEKQLSDPARPSSRSCTGEETDASAVLDMEGAKFGIINSLRTGHPVKDMVTAMMVPMVFKAVFMDSTKALKPVFDAISAYFSPKAPQTFERHIEVETLRNQYGWNISNDENRNTVLMRALTLYLAEKDLKYKSADVNLVSLKENNFRYDSDEEGSGDEDTDTRSEVGQLKKNYRLTRTAPEEQWTQVEPGVMYMKVTDNGDEEGGGGKEAKLMKKKVKISISAATEEQVDGFISKAYTWYLDELKKQQDNSRYMYELVASETKKDGDDGEDAQVRRYRRYKLSDEKTFDCLFFPEKDTLLKILGDFKARSGKYAIPGYPHKLGLLCHGPPGTGKTSLIKAVAHHTQRNIVNVALARIQTNAELMDVMFDSRYQVLGQDLPIKLRFKDIVFVMEDVDAISKIVHRRDGKDGKAECSEVASKPAAVETAEAGDESAKPAEKKEEKVEKPAVADDSGSEDGKGSKTQDGAAALLTSLLAPVSGPTVTASGTGSSSGTDKLNLSGVLNALDGVVDSPNRILVMTTNHLEKLDPALIRPGRIDKKFLLNYMQGAQAHLMVGHYFQKELSEEETTRIALLVDGTYSRPALELTPARLEQLCAEHDEVPDLCSALEALGQPLVPTLTRVTSTNVENRLSARAQTVPYPADLPAKKW